MESESKERKAGEKKLRESKSTYVQRVRCLDEGKEVYSVALSLSAVSPHT